MTAPTAYTIVQAAMNAAAATIYRDTRAKPVRMRVEVGPGLFAEIAASAPPSAVTFGDTLTIPLGCCPLEVARVYPR